MVASREPGAPLLIVFSSVNSNGFSFYKQFSTFEANKIFVRDSTDNWFQGGTGKVTKTFDELLERLRAEVAELAPSKLITFGTSMGGYAAIVVGNLLGADAIVASSPQTILDPRLPHTPKENHSAKPYFDLRTLLADPIADRRHIVFFGCDDTVDVFNVSRMPWFQCQQIGVAHQDHLAAVLLAKAGEYERCLEACIRGEPYEPKVEQDGRVFDHELRRLSRGLIEAHYLKGGADVMAAAEELIAADPTWAAPQFNFAEILIEAEDFEQAEVAARKAAELSPKSVTFSNLHANLLLRLDRNDEALAAFDRTLGLRTRHYASLCGKAVVLARQGDKEAALKVLEDAIGIRPRLQRAYQLRDSLAGEDKLVRDMASGDEDM